MAKMPCSQCTGLRSHVSQLGVHMLQLKILRATMVLNTANKSKTKREGKEGREGMKRIIIIKSRCD